MVSARFTALAFAAAASAQIVPAPVTCPTNGAPYLMVGPGCMIPCFSHGYGNLATLVSNITTYYPGTSTYTVPYTNNTLQGQVSTPVFVAQANAIYQQCPESPIVMVGHSLGGIIVMNTLCGGNFPYTTNVVAAVTYGEETYVGGQPYDTGSCTSNAPNFTRQSTAGCQKWTPILQDYCMADDAKCCATGTSVAVHQEYAQFYDLQAFAFIKAQLAKFVAPVISSSSSSSVVSSTSTSTSSSSTFSPTDASITSSTASSTESASSADSTSTLTTTVATTSYSTISISTATAPGFTNSSVPAGSASSTSAAASGSESGSVAPVSSTTGPAPVAPATPVPTTVTTVVPISFTSVVGGSTIVISASLTTDVPGVVVSSSFQPTYAYPTVPLSAVAESLTGSAQSSYLAAVSSASASLASAASAASATPAEAKTTTSVVKLAPSAEGAPSKSGAAGAGVGPASSTQKAGSKPSGTSAGTLPAYTGAASQLSMPVSLCIAIAALMFFQA